MPQQVQGHNVDTGPLANPMYYMLIAGPRGPRNAGQGCSLVGLCTDYPQTVSSRYAARCPGPEPRIPTRPRNHNGIFQGLIESNFRSQSLST